MGIGGAVDAVSNLARDLYKPASEAAEKSGVAKMGRETFLAQAEEFKRSPEGMKVGTRLVDYDFRRQQILNDLVKPVTAVHEVIKNDPTQLRSTLGKLHSDFKTQAHPVASDAGKIIALDSANAELTLQEYTAKLGPQARLLAQQQVTGENHSLLIGDLMPLYEKGDPFSEAHAQALMDIASNQFHDATRPLELGQHGVSLSGVDQSKLKLNMKSALMLENKFRQANGEEPLNIDLNKIDTASVHERTNAVERFASKRARIFLAPMIAINHMSTFFNPVSAAPLESISKAMAGMENGEIKELSDAAAIFASQHFHMLMDDMSSETNPLVTKIGKPEVGRLYNQIFHNPGFNFIRNVQLKATAAMGYHAANYWAEQAFRGDKLSAIELKDLGLNPDEIIKRGGQLTREEKIKAIYYFTNNRAFISRPFDRSLTATRNPWTRMLTMFHGYVSSQQRFMRRELQKKLEARDYVGIARYAGTVGLLFPTIAPMLKAAETVARTGSPSTAIGGMQKDYETLEHPENVAQFSAEYLDMLSYFGSWGIMHSFIGAAHGDRLALALMGPIAGDAVRTAQDTINFSTKSTKTGKHNIKPLAKDILQQTVPGVGNIVAHQIFPANTVNQ